MGYSLLAVERIERQRATLDPSPRPEWDKPQPMPPDPDELQAAVLSDITKAMRTASLEDE
jgi:hypothetical protein